MVAQLLRLKLRLFANGFRRPLGLVIVSGLGLALALVVVVLVAPIACESDGYTSPAFPAALHAVADAIRRLHSLVPRAPLNLWLHTFTSGENHWHFELLPRLTVFAGLELGAGLSGRRPAIGHREDPEPVLGEQLRGPACVRRVLGHL